MDDALIEIALAQWGYAGAPFTLIAERENRVYKVTLDTKPVALRVHRKGLRSTAELISELDWMSMLGDAGLHVPRPMPALNGASHIIVEGTLIDVVSWLNGAPLSDTTPTREDFNKLGVLMAQMHDLADHWTPPKHFTRPKWDGAGLIGNDALWGLFWENPTLDAAQIKRLKTFRGYAAEALDSIQNRLDYGLIHADLVPENILTENGNLFAIDFDDGGFGFRLFDIATVTNRTRRIAPDGSLANALLAGYKSERDIDAAHLPLFEALRACTYLGWIIPRLSEPNAQTRNARFIDEAFARINALSR